MKRQIHPAVIAIILTVAIGLVVFLIWRGSEGINPGPGRMESDLDMGRAAEDAKKDPAKFQKELEESLKRDRERNNK